MLHISKFLILIFLLGKLVQAQDIPDKMIYCGIELTFTQKAKDKLATHVAAIYESTRFFNVMVGRADTYMPFIEEGLKAAGAPDDLKYLAIQESSLKSDAVSSSNAVGFWQFKKPAGVQFGLAINDQIDQRKHVYEASVAAGSYFKKANNDFDNWIYAVISYYEGMTGAIPHTKPVYYSAKKMPIDHKLHWYALKAIAHKIAYQKAIGMERNPSTWLEPFSTQGETLISKLYTDKGVSSDQFFEYNKWILNKGNLPVATKPYTYYIPRIDQPYAGHIQDPNSEDSDPIASNDTPKPPQGGDDTSTPTPSPTPPKPPRPRPKTVGGQPLAKEINKQSGVAYAEFKLLRDLSYGQEYVIFSDDIRLTELAVKLNIPLSRLLEWNEIKPSNLPFHGQILYLNKPKKAVYHIVEKGETLAEVARKHLSKVSKIQKKNRMKKNNKDIFIGQKLYLKKKKTKGERIIILKKGKEFQSTTPPPAHPGTPPPKNSSPGFPVDNSGKPPVTPDPVNPPEETQHDEQTKKWVEHTVEAGETLWRISVAYGTKVEIIKLTNKLTSDTLSPGMKLRILASVKKLKEMGKE